MTTGNFFYSPLDFVFAEFYLATRQVRQYEHCTNTHNLLRRCTMTVLRWDPLRELAEMSERLNRVVSRQGNGPMDGNGQEVMTTADWIPTVDISETEAEYAIQAELPGVKKEDVKVTLQNDVLTIRGERRQQQ